MDNLPEFSIFNLNHAKRILAVQPHYDDNDIGAGGTLYSLTQNDAELIYVTVTDDLAGVINPDLSHEQAMQEIQDNQIHAGEIIGVQEQLRLGFPDAGSYDYFQLREQIINLIRSKKPDLLLTVDPWMPYEAHNDHIQTGKAVAEAAILYNLPSLGKSSDSEIKGYELKAVAFYNTAYPNLTYDITNAIDCKRNALHSYSAQFSDEGLDNLISQTTLLANYHARGEAFEFGESFKIVSPWMLHCLPITMYL